MKKAIDPRRIELLDAEVVAILKTKTPAEKLAMAFESNRLVRSRIAGHLLAKHPEWTESELNAGVARRLGNGAA